MRHAISPRRRPPITGRARRAVSVPCLAVSVPRLAVSVLCLALTALPSAADSRALPASASGQPDRQPEGMFELYEDNRRRGIANYVTEDFLVLSYLMLLERTVESMERARSAPAFSRLVDRLAAGLGELPEGEARRANEQFLSVLETLLAGGDPDPALEDPVRAEVERVLAAADYAFSPIAAQRLDYSQFRLRGRYTRDPELSRYFRAARYAGTVLFAVQPSKATAITAQAADRLTAQALQLSRLIATLPEVRAAWEDLDRQADWWFGPADDLELEDLRQVAGQTKGNPQSDLPELRRRLLEHARATGRQPRILGAAVDLDRLEPTLTAHDVLTGWRLFPQRYTPESAAFGRLVHDRVGSYLGSDSPKSLGFAGGRPVKSLPSALELMVLLGSETAGSRLDATDERNYQGYAQAAEEARVLLSQARGLGGEHLSLLRFWLTHDRAPLPAAGYRPKTDARRTNTALAFWTYRRYVGLLYSKQSYSGVSKGFAMPPERTSAWLEPAAELYALLARGADELAARTESTACAAYARILERCIRIAVCERAGLELDAGEVEFLNDLDHRLLKLIGRHDRPIVVDVHSDPASRQVVQEGIGWPRVVEKDLGREQPSRGALFSHYELHQPISERLDDDAWAQMLLAGTIQDRELR